MNMGEKIYKLRKEKGLTLEQLGDMVGVGKSTVRKWENGMIANMKRNKIIEVAKALNTTPAYLMGWEEDPGSSDGYYENDETAQIAQEIHDNTELRALFSAAKDADPQTLKDIHDMLLIMKRRERGDTE